MLKEEWVENGVCILTLNQPEKANALSLSLLQALKETLLRLQSERTLRCLVITGQGEKAFCAGADLKERASMSTEEVIKTVQLIKDTVNILDKLPQPTIAAINGAAFGGGLELALACDIRIASLQAKMGLTETSLGIIPGAGGTQRLPRLVGTSKAKELIFCAKKIGAKEACDIGLVNQIVPDEQLLEYTKSTASTISSNAPIAVKEAKRAIQLGIETNLDHALKIETLCYKTTIPTQDRLEGLQAFKEKRKPIYSGK